MPSVAAMPSMATMTVATMTVAGQRWYWKEKRPRYSCDEGKLAKHVFTPFLY
jgi:hypothetical protein